MSGIPLKTFLGYQHPFLIECKIPLPGVLLNSLWSFNTKETVSLQGKIETIPGMFHGAWRKAC